MGHLEPVRSGPVARGRKRRVLAGATRVSEKPRLLVIERESELEQSARRTLADHYDLTTARSMARALALLREQQFSAVFVDTAQLSAVRWAGVLIQAEEI